MRFYIEFDEENEKEIIEYINQMDKEDRSDLKSRMKYEAIEYCEREMEKEKRAREQRNCTHDFAEVSRSDRDEDGERYFDDDGVYDRVWRVRYECSKCNQINYKTEYE